MPTPITRGATSAKAFGFTGASAQTGVIVDVAYNAPGTYTWIAPACVTSVSVVAVGGGGGGSPGFCCACLGLLGGTGGFGASLRYINNYCITPGNSYTVVVGAGGIRGTTVSANGPGGSSYFLNTSTLYAKGGNGSGTNVGTGGGNGGIGGGYPFLNAGGGGGGAGGYSGNGG
jgi:hypothetical protein